MALAICSRSKVSAGFLNNLEEVGVSECGDSGLYPGTEPIDVCDVDVAVWVDYEPDGDSLGH